MSAYYAHLATHEQLRKSRSLPIGHAGVQLVLEAVYTKRVQLLNATLVVDLLRATASYLQLPWVCTADISARVCLCKIRAALWSAGLPRLQMLCPLLR